MLCHNCHKFKKATAQNTSKLPKTLQNCPKHFKFFRLPNQPLQSQDLCAVKDRTLIEEMKVLVTSWLQHVDNCGLCKGKGFICELCARVSYML